MIMTDIIKSTITCPRCQATEMTEGPEHVNLASVGLFECVCGCRAVYGRVQPRIVVEPFVDARGFTWLRRRFQDGVTLRDIFTIDTDPKHAAREAVNILSITVGT